MGFVQKLKISSLFQIVLTHFSAHSFAPAPFPSTPSVPALLGQVHVHDPPPLLGQLSPGLRVRVVHGEVGHDDGHGEGHGQHAPEGAQRAHEHAQVRLGGHVPVAHGGHGDQGPPEAEGDGIEIVVRIGLFEKEHACVLII